MTSRRVRSVAELEVLAQSAESLARHHGERKRVELANKYRKVARDARRLIARRRPDPQ